MKILILTGSLTHTGFFIFGLFYALYPLSIYSGIAALLLLIAAFFIQIKNFIFFYTFTYVELIANITYLEYWYSSSFGLSLYFMILIPISTFILSSPSMNKTKYTFISFAVIINIISYILFSEYLTLLSGDVQLPDHLRLLFFTITSVGAGLMIAILAFYYTSQMQNRYNLIMAQKDALAESINHDELTGLYSRRFMSRYLNELFEKSKTSSKEFCICMADIDYFKQFNDTYGHDAGDLVLRTIAPFLFPLINDPDNLVCRWGGEEFLFIIPGDNQAAEKLIEQVRINIENIVLSYKHSKLKITMTFGISESNKHYLTVESMINAADKKLYEGKSSGRNCVK